MLWAQNIALRRLQPCIIICIYNWYHCNYICILYVASRSRRCVGCISVLQLGYHYICNAILIHLRYWRLGLHLAIVLTVSDSTSEDNKIVHRKFPYDKRKNKHILSIMVEFTFTFEITYTPRYTSICIAYCFEKKWNLFDKGSQLYFFTKFKTFH